MSKLTMPLTRLLAAFMAISLSALTLASTPRVTADAQWTLAKDKDNIQLYTRPVAGSDFLAIRASTVMAADSDAVAAALGDGDGCSEWRRMCKSSRILEVASEQERLIYMVLDLPWPLSDRDVVMRSITHIDPQSKTAVVKLQSDSGAYPAQKQVRAQCNGQFIIKVLGEKQVEVAYEMHADLGGDISADMVKSRQISATLAEMGALRALVER